MDPYEQFPSYKGVSLEDLRQYTDVLLGAAELAQALESHDAKMTDQHYRISDPRIIEMIEIPDRISCSLHSTDHLTSLTFQSTMHSTDNSTLASSLLGLEFPDDSVFIHQDVESGQTIATYTCDDILPHTLPAEALSNIIARAIHPSNDPSFSQYQDINHPQRALEICDTLNENEFTTKSIERTFNIDDEYQIITSTVNGKLYSCEITEFRDTSAAPISLTIEFQHFANASNLYKSTRDGSEELVLDAGDLDRFMQIIATIKHRLTPDTTDNFRNT